ncbi:EAL domain-containing protein [Maribrevibacterium harenarium]|uniref:EAL domain-containing protein n=1 Tax=Maribrevibacterium harenarium TaxID=2589817 RepID=A0A501X1G9_9GAMM|nr:EAL domain-containing protein [Maribrevibacterium harenarium]TPE54146.1 EAL domain-containing protein [Maribrevibacterium harenarium]
MLKGLQIALRNFIRHQPILILSVVVLSAAMVFVMDQVLTRGEQRALDEQSTTNAALIYAMEDSISRSLQAISGSLRSMASAPLQNPRDNQIIIEQMLMSLPQLREINILPLYSSRECLPTDRQLSPTDVVILPPRHGRYWGDDAPLAATSYWPACVPFFVNEKVVGFVVGSINLNYYRDLLHSVAPGEREVSLYLATGQTILGVDEQLPDTIAKQLSEQVWGSYRGSDDRGSFIESYRASSMLPLVVTLKSYDSIALADWLKDARMLRWIFALMIGLVLLMVTVFAILKHKREEVQGSNHLLSEAVRNSANAIIITDPKGKIQWVNDAFTRLTGYSIKQVKGKTPRLLNSGHHDKAFFQELWSTISVGHNWRGELVNRHKLGHLISVEQTITPIRDSHGEIEYFIAVHEDITARKEAEKQAMFLAQHDDLTGLANRRFFENQLNERLRQFSSGRIGLMFIDLDRFKEINDTLGHDAGDVLLKRTAKKLAKVVPDEAYLARLGGDEFALFVHPLSHDSVMSTLAKSVVSILAKPFEYKNTKFSVSCSVGVAVANMGEIDASSLLRQADMAMYRAKHSGKNTYRYFDESMDQRMRYRVALQQELDVAIREHRGLSLRYQPQVDAYSHAIIGAEALLRWQNDHGAWVSPADFIPIAEESGQIIELGRWIIRQVLLQLKDWRKAGLDFGKVAINVSSVQLSSSFVADDLLEMMAELELPTHCVAVEFTETALMVNSSILAHNLARLRESNITIAIDDFGTGYCSLSYLKELDAHYLKVDRSFVDGIGISDSDECIVSATIAMAKGLGMKVVAEGVETQQQTEFLAKQDCDAIQGYFFGKPMTAEEFAEKLSQRALQATL